MNEPKHSAPLSQPVHAGSGAIPHARGPREPSFTPTPRTAAVELPPTATLTGPLDFAQFFGRVAPVVVEIGCGAGRTVISMATARPERNYLGLEIAGEFYKELRERAFKRNWPHLKVGRIDAAFLVERYFAASSVDEYHIYFPDPWPKKRHHKRRLFSERFCAQLRRTLKPGCALNFATDHADYYAELLPRLKAELDVREPDQLAPTLAAK